MERIKYLDGWRGLAILGVLVDHFLFSRGINFGRIGVELFFVLSGRLIAEILFTKGAELKLFYCRRAARIYPTLLVAILVISTLSFLFSESVNPLQFVSAVTLTYNYAQLYLGRASLIDHIWSLCIEEHMYLVLGLIALVVRKIKVDPLILITILAGVFMVNGALQTASGLDYNSVYWRSDTRGASILCGAAAFFVYERYRNSSLGQWPYLSLVSGICGIILNINIVPDPIKYSLGTIAFAVSAAFLPNAKNALRNVLSNKVFVYLGVVSFSVYLWQQPFASLPWGHLAKTGLLSVAVCAGIASYYLVERPTREWLKRVIDNTGQPSSSKNV